MRPIRLAPLLGALTATTPALAAPPGEGLLAARKGFVTEAAPSTYRADGAASEPPPGPFQRVRYRSPAGDLVAYVTRDPRDGQKHPAVVWAHGGFGGVGPDDLEQVQPLVAAGLVVMCPSWRGENDNRGRFEMFYGEVDDALAAVDHVARLPYVDPARVYVAGHSSGGTIALLVAEATDRARAVYSLGGAPDLERVLAAGGYDDATPPFPVGRAREAELRSAKRFVTHVKVPTYYFEGGRGSANAAEARLMARTAHDAEVPFFAETIARGDHFDIVAPLLAVLGHNLASDVTSITPAQARAAYDAAYPVTVSLAVMRDPVAAFEMTLRAEDAGICLVLPAGAEDPKSCASFDPEAARAGMAASSPGTAAITYVAFRGWNVGVTVTHHHVAPRLDTAAGRDEFARGMAVGATRASPGARLRGELPGTAYTVVTVDGRSALKVIVELDPAAPAAVKGFDRTVTYALPSDGELMLIQFMGNASVLAELNQFADASIATAHLRPQPPGGLAGASLDYRLGYAVGAAIPVVVASLGLVFWIVTLRRKDSRRERR
jgi:dienelactone hydrolase